MLIAPQRLATVLLVVLVVIAGSVGAQIVANGVGLSDDSFVYIDQALQLNRDFAWSDLRPRWFPPVYGGLVSLFLGIDGTPIGAASWLNAVLLVTLAVALFRAIRDLTGNAVAAFALAIAAVFSKAVTFPFQFAWSEPAFIAIAAVHLYALVRYLTTSKLASLAVCTLSGALLIWTRFAAVNTVLPLLLFAGWDLRRASDKRLPRAALHLAGLTLFAIVPIWNPNRFVGKLLSASIPDMGSASVLEPAHASTLLNVGPAVIADVAARSTLLLASAWKLFVATQAAAGPALFYAFVFSALGCAWWWIDSRLQGPRPEAPSGAPTDAESADASRPFVVLGYVLVWLASFNIVLVEHLSGFTGPENPLRPFVELRFAAPNLPWIVVGLGAVWGALQRMDLGWQRRLPAVMATLAIGILGLNVAADRDAIAEFVDPPAVALPFQYGYAGQNRDESDQIAAFLDGAAREGSPLVVVLLATEAEGMPPPIYFRSVFFQPHRSGAASSPLRFRIARAERDERHEFEIGLDGNPTAPGSKRLHYVESCADLSPEATVETLVEERAEQLDRFVLLTPARRRLQSKIEAFARLGYRNRAELISGYMAWIFFEKN